MGCCIDHSGAVGPQESRAMRLMQGRIAAPQVPNGSHYKLWWDPYFLAARKAAGCMRDNGQLRKRVKRDGARI